MITRILSSISTAILVLECWIIHEVLWFRTSKLSFRLYVLLDQNRSHFWELMLFIYLIINRHRLWLHSMVIPPPSLSTPLHAHGRRQFGGEFGIYSRHLQLTYRNQRIARGVTRMRNKVWWINDFDIFCPLLFNAVGFQTVRCRVFQDRSSFCGCAYKY